MARPRLLDMMQNYPFWVFDASGPSGNALLSIFDPALGFSAVTAPEISVETKDIQPGNWEYKRRVVKSAEAGPVSLSRGARFYDSDFYNWITGAIVGRQPIRRTLVIVHFLGWRVQAQALNANLSFPDTAVIQAGLRTPGRGWILYDCLPTRYKAGSDFDATSSDVSIQELEVQPEHIAELTLATISPVAARATSAAIEVVNAVVQSGGGG